MEKFYVFLKDKDVPFLKKQEIEAFYKEFCQLWDIQKPFSTVFDALRKTYITYIIDSYWAIIQDEPLILASEFLSYKNIANYYGLQTAMYLNKKTWQAQTTYYLINTTYQRTRTIQNTKIQFIKFPKELIIKQAIKQETIPYSDTEKTILDMLYQNTNPKQQPEDIETINLYLYAYKKYPYIRAQLIEVLDAEKRAEIK
jgi:hypothetical protein